MAEQEILLTTNCHKCGTDVEIRAVYCSDCTENKSLTKKDRLLLWGVLGATDEYQDRLDRIAKSMAPAGDLLTGDLAANLADISEGLEEVTTVLTEVLNA